MRLPLNLSVEARSAVAASDLGEHALQRRRIRVAVQDVAAGVVEAHERAAHRGVLEDEARERVDEGGAGIHASTRCAQTLQGTV